jgi:hypothetical protein
VLDRLVDPRAGLAPRHAQKAAMMQALQQMRADVQVAAPPLHAAVVEVRLQVPGSGVTVLTHEVQHVSGARLHPGVPLPPLSARMEQRKALSRQETVVHEEGLFDRQARVAALQLAGAIALDPMREDQILGARRRPHRVGLDEPQARDGARQAGGLEKTARDRVAAKLPEAGGFGRTHAPQSTPAKGVRESGIGRRCAPRSGRPPPRSARIRRARQDYGRWSLICISRVG